MDISNVPITITPEKSFEAITSGAGINIDVTRHTEATNVFDAFDEIKTKFPKGCINAILNSKESPPVSLTEISGRWSDKQVAVHLTAVEGVPTGIDFNSVEITSCKKLNGVFVKWVNYSK